MSPLASPASSLVSSTRTAPSASDTISTRPSCEATATLAPSGATTSSSTRPSSSAREPAGAAAVADLERVVTVGIGHPDRAAGLARKYPRQPGAHAGGVGERAHRAVAVGEPLHGAVHVDGARATLAVDRHRLGGAERRADLGHGRLPADPSAGKFDLDGDRFDVGGERVEAIEHARALVDELRRAALEVAGEIAGVVAGVIAVPAQVGAVGEHRVDVAVALVIGHERQPVAEPDRIGELTVQLREQPLELAGAARGRSTTSGGCRRGIASTSPARD